jgi:hypothetical protein
VIAHWYGQDRTEVCWWRTAATDDNGVYVIAKLPNRHFLVGAHTQRATVPEKPFHGAFYPGVDKAGDAELIDLSAGGVRSGIDFRVAGPFPERRITVALVLPDGRPAAGESVGVADAKGYPASVVLIDATGRGIFTGCQNTGYTFWSQWMPGRRSEVVHAEPVSIAAGTADGQVRLVLSSPGFFMDHHRGEYALTANPLPARAPR